MIRFFRNYVVIGFSCCFVIVNHYALMSFVVITVLICFKANKHHKVIMKGLWCCYFI